MIIKKLQAGALQVVLFVAVIIAVIVSSFILLIHFHKQFDLQTDFINQNIDNAQKGIDYALVNEIDNKDSLELDFKFKDYESVTISKNYWGVFEKVTSIAKIKNNTFNKVALIGSQPIKQDRTALYLEDNNKPLIVVGNTKIVGISFLPKQGVKPGNIAGQSYYGTKLIYGKTRTSSNLPELNSDLSNSFNNYKRSDDIQYLDLGRERVHRNSFNSIKKRIYSNTDITLSEITLIGHIEVISKTKITVDKSVVLQDVLLIAPEIVIEDNVESTFQAISSKKITIGKNCRLNYPSALVLKTKPYLTEEPNFEEQIMISENTTINGLIVYDGITDTNNFSSQISIKEESEVIGEVYCSGNLELKGTVIGTVYTSNFVTNESGSIYQNHIYNANIYADELEKEFVGLQFENSNKGIAKWLY